jgi:hypothetical protein
MAFLYPEGDTFSGIELGEFETLEACRSAALRSVSRMAGGGTYECGKNCRPDESTANLVGGPLYICEETVD